MKHVLLAFLLAATPSVAFAQNAETENAENGKRIFENFGCAGCHGYEGQGSRDGARLNPAPSIEVMLLQLRQPRDLMPRYQESLISNRDAADLHAYLASFPPAPDPKTIRLLTEN